VSDLRALLRFWNPRAVCDDERRRDEAATNRFLVEIFTIRQNDHLLGSWVEHAKAVWVKPFLLAEVGYRAKSGARRIWTEPVAHGAAQK